MIKAKKRGISLALALVLLFTLMPVLSFDAFAAVAAQTIGGEGADGTKEQLQITVGIDGKIAEYRLTESGSYQYQYYSTNSNGTAVMFDAGGAEKNLGAAYMLYYILGEELLVSSIEKSADGRSITTTYYDTVDPASASVKLDLIVSYAYNSESLYKTFVLTNLSETEAITNVHITHGGDTYFANSDEGYSYYDSAMGMVFLTKDASSGMMSFRGIGDTPADNYWAGYYSDGAEWATQRVTTNTVDSNFQDNGYYLRWIKDSLAAGETWTITSMESFSAAGQIMLTGLTDGITAPGGRVPYLFVATNVHTEAIDVVLDIECDDASLTPYLTTLGGVSTNSDGDYVLTVPASSSVTLQAELLVPEDTEDETVCPFKINATYPVPGSDTDTSTNSVSATTYVNVDAVAVMNTTDIEITEKKLSLTVALSDGYPAAEATELVVTLKNEDGDVVATYTQTVPAGSVSVEVTATIAPALTDPTANYFLEITGPAVGLSPFKIATSAISASATFYTLTVSGGTGGGSYTAGAKVTISANAPSAGMTFGGWSSNNGGSFANAALSETEFTMPEGDVTVTAGFTSVGGFTDIPSSTPEPEDESLVIVDGKEVDAGKVTVDIDTGTTTTVVNQEVITDQIVNATDNVTVIVPKSEDSSTAVAELVVKNVDDMAAGEITLSVQVGNVTYEVPTAAVDTQAILESLGAENASDVPISISITTEVSDEVQATVEQAIAEFEGEIVFPPMQFTITASYNGQTVDVTEFGGYVSRAVEITEEQASKITTAIVIEPDGTVRHVPTKVYQKNGKWYAEINSLTNSTYVLIANEASFTDIEGKWFESYAQEAGDRKIVNGYPDGTFGGDGYITRAEFTQLLVSALGLPATGNGAVFTDINSADWFAGSVGAAYEHGLVSGFPDGSFAPDANITRQEAMQMIKNAAKIANYNGISGALDAFADGAQVADWAWDAVSFCVGSGLVGGFDGRIMPNADITRGEVAAITLRLLRAANLVDIRS